MTVILKPKRSGVQSTTKQLQQGIYRSPSTQIFIVLSEELDSYMFRPTIGNLKVIEYIKRKLQLHVAVKLDK